MAKKRPAKKRAAKRRAKTAKTRKEGRANQPASASLESLARKMVRLTQSPTFGVAELRALYTDDATSEESTGNVARGIAGLEEKLEGWDQMQSATSWKARNVWVGPRTVCIEWDATVNLRDGRTVSLREVGVHEIKSGKIQAERFYYNPMVFAPPTS